MTDYGYEFLRCNFDRTKSCKSGSALVLLPVISWFDGGEPIPLEFLLYQTFYRVHMYIL